MDDDVLTAEETAALDAMRAADDAPLDPPPADGAGGAAIDSAPAAPDGADPAAGADGALALVPHEAMHKERTRRQAVEKQLVEQRQHYESRLNQVLEVFGAQARQPAAPPQAQAPAAPVPVLEQDPVGFIVHSLEKANGNVDVVRQQLAEFQQREQHNAALNSLQQQVAVMESDFKATTPDYDAATQHLVASRHRELELAGFDNPLARQEMVRQEALGIAARAMQAGRNPAEMYYELAKHRGYSQAPAAPVAATAAQRVDQIAAGQQQGRTLGAVRGAAPAAFNTKTVLDMEDGAFADWLSKASLEQKKAVMGA